MTRRSIIVGVCALAAASMALPACGNDDGGGGSDGGSGASGGATSVDVTLQEFAVIPGATSAPAGTITFNATNEGPEDDHELVVIRTDLAPDALPTVETGAADEEGEGVEAIDEIEEFPPGETQSLTLDLAAGSYVLICNVYSEDEQESHYHEGMRVAFTVT
jgi:uncharacterized cupredoxin-like copper-binding protein